MAGSARDASGYSPRADTMVMYFLSQIGVRIKWLEARDESAADTIKDIRAGIAQLRDQQGDWTEDSAWTEAYRLERLLALVEPTSNLVSEIQRRLDEAAEDKVAAEPRLRAGFEGVKALAIDETKTPPALQPTAEPLLRTLLLDILEESHWTAQRRFFASPLAKSATKKIVWIGLASALLLLLPYLVLFATVLLDRPLSIERWPWVALWTALTAGLFGAFFSRLWDIQARGSQLSLTELKSAREFSSLSLRGAVGMCGALVLFFLLQSNIVDGSLFPDFEKIGFRQIGVPLSTPPAANSTSLRLILPTPDLALLVVWCFLAGFSERLVPTVLSSTETALSEAAQPRRNPSRDQR
jgi:hypothetical protein